MSAIPTATQNAGQTIRVHTHGREFMLEGMYAVGSQSVQITLYENGAEIAVEMFPILAPVTGVSMDPEIERGLKQVKAQIEELYQFLNELAAKPDTASLLLLAGLFDTRGLINEALSIYETVGKLDPENPERLYRHGIDLLETGRFAEAALACKTAVDLKPLYADYRNHYGLALVWSGRVVDGFTQLDQALELNLYFADAYFSYGLALLFNGIKRAVPDKAADFHLRSLHMFEKAATIDSGYHMASYEEGIRALTAGDYRAAFGAMRRARTATLRRRETPYSDRRAELRERIFHNDETVVRERIMSLSTRLSANPQFVDLAEQLARSYFLMGALQWRQGIERLAQVVSIKGTTGRVEESREAAVGLESHMRALITAMEKRG